jgi:hypothetical protein
VRSCIAACDERRRGSWRGAGFQQVPTVHQGENEPIRDDDADDDVAGDVAPLHPKNTDDV